MLLPAEYSKKEEDSSQSCCSSLTRRTEETLRRVAALPAEYSKKGKKLCAAFLPLFREERRRLCAEQCRSFTAGEGGDAQSSAGLSREDGGEDAQSSVGLSY